MKTVRILTLCIVFALCHVTKMMAQDDPEYRMEVGAGVGLDCYVGDFNSNVLSGSNLTPAFSVLLRRVINPYSALQFALATSKMKGESKNVKTFYPDFNTQMRDESAREDYKFSNMLIDFNAMYEYNFQPYGTGRDYRGAKRLTPYIALGLGFTYVNSKKGTVDLEGYYQPSSQTLYGSPEMNGSKSVFTANLPLAFGVKYKMAERINLGVEWAMHFTLSDKLDGVKDPTRINSTGIFKNTDCYSALRLSLTYSFWEKCKTCNKD